MLLFFILVVDMGTERCKKCGRFKEYNDKWEICKDCYYKTVAYCPDMCANKDMYCPFCCEGSHFKPFPEYRHLFICGDE